MHARRLGLQEMRRHAEYPNMTVIEVEPTPAEPAAHPADRLPSQWLWPRTAPQFVVSFALALVLGVTLLELLP